MIIFGQFSLSAVWRNVEMKLCFMHVVYYNKQKKLQYTVVQ